MTEASTQPTQPTATGPQLVVEKIPFESCEGERFKWRLEEDGRLIAMGAGDFASNWDAAQDAARVSLTILNSLSMSFCRLSAEMSKVQEKARAKFDEAKARGEAGTAGEPQKFASAHAIEEEESEEELGERARLDAEAEAPDDEGEAD